MLNYAISGFDPFSRLELKFHGLLGTRCGPSRFYWKPGNTSRKSKILINSISDLHLVALPVRIPMLPSHWGRKYPLTTRPF